MQTPQPPTRSRRLLRHRKCRLRDLLRRRISGRQPPYPPLPIQHDRRRHAPHLQVASVVRAPVHQKRSGHAQRAIRLAHRLDRIAPVKHRDAHHRDTVSLKRSAVLIKRPKGSSARLAVDRPELHHRGPRARRRNRPRLTGRPVGQLDPCLDATRMARRLARLELEGWRASRQPDDERGEARHRWGKRDPSAARDVHGEPTASQ